MYFIFFDRNLAGRRPHRCSNIFRSPHHDALNDSLSAYICSGFLQKAHPISTQTNRAEHFCSAAHLYCLFTSFFTITFIELFDTATSLLGTLLACKERMAFRANFNTQFRFSRTCFECITTSTRYFGVAVVFRMDSFFQNLHLFSSIIQNLC